MSGAEEKKTCAPFSGAGGRRRIRWIVRAFLLAAAAALLWPAAKSGSWAGVVPALSPWVAAASFLSTWTVHTLAWLGWMVGLICLLRHRWFCRWMCPAGLCTDGASWLGRRGGRRSLRLAAAGRWISWLTLGGAFLGYPVLLWLDPLAMFSSLFRIGGANWGLAAVLGTLGLPLVLLISLFWPDLWCGQVCPLGAFQDQLTALARFPGKILRRDPSPRRGTLLPRRTVLGVGIGVVCALAVRRTRATRRSPLRPPGALGEPDLLGVCIRCGSCARVCPSGIIESDSGEGGIAGLLTPVLSFQDDYCREDCARCMDVCPSGALRRFSLEDKQEVRIGFPRLDMKLCLLGDDRECTACRRSCPYGAIRYVWSESEYTLTPRIDSRRCNGCGACEAACPTRPRRAIAVMPSKVGFSSPLI